MGVGQGLWMKKALSPYLAGADSYQKYSESATSQCAQA